MICTKHKWNYSLFSRAYHLIMIAWVLISWVTNTLTIIGFDIVHPIDYQSRTLRNEHFRAWILAFKVDIVDVLFCVFRFSKASFNALTSSWIDFITFQNFAVVLALIDTYGRLPWHFYNFTCDIINEHLKFCANIKEQFNSTENVPFFFL